MLDTHREAEFRLELEPETISGEGARTCTSGPRIVFGVDEGDERVANRSVNRAGARKEVLGAFDDDPGRDGS